MPVKKDKINPVAFFAIGVCFMGAGITLTFALDSKSGSAIGIVLCVGVLFIIIGAARKQNNQSG